jgi:hypothetical protein
VTRHHGRRHEAAPHPAHAAGVGSPTLSAGRPCFSYSIGDGKRGQTTGSVSSGG